MLELELKQTSKYRTMTRELEVHYIRAPAEKLPEVKSETYIPKSHGALQIEATATTSYKKKSTTIISKLA